MTPALHQSTAKLLLRSPLHAWHKVFGNAEEESTEATDLGTLAHALILGGKDITVVDAKDWRTNDAKEQRDIARKDGKVPVLASKFKEAGELTCRVVAEIQKRYEISLTGQSELEIEWESDGVKCAGRLDHFIPTGRIYDLKFVRSAAKRSCENAIVEYGYDIQHAAYVEGIEYLHPELRGRLRFEFIFVESEAPHAIRLMPLAGSMRTLGEWRWSRAKELWAFYTEKYGANQWPGYDDDREPAEAPAWALTDQKMQDEIAAGGNL